MIILNLVSVFISKAFMPILCSSLCFFKWPEINFLPPFPQETTSFSSPHSFYTHRHTHTHTPLFLFKGLMPSLGRKLLCAYQDVNSCLAAPILFWFYTRCCINALSWSFPLIEWLWSHLLHNTVEPECLAVMIEQNESFGHVSAAISIVTDKGFVHIKNIRVGSWVF